MVHVLEGTSMALATTAAAGDPRARSGCRPTAFTLPRLRTARSTRSTCASSPDLMDRLEDPADRAAVVHVATGVYRLYGDIFRALPRVDAPAPAWKAA